MTEFCSDPPCDTWRLPHSPANNPARCPIDPQPRSLDEASLNLPGGAYTTFRTYRHNQAFHLDDHLKRLAESARLTGRTAGLDREQIRATVCQAIDGYPAVDTRIRLSLDLERCVGDIYISLETLHTPTALQYEQGIGTVTLKMSRENPEAKLTGFIVQASIARQTLPAGIPEGIMLNEQDEILEGLSSNFFGVIDGEVYTSNQAVLSGITRALVLEEAALAGIRLHLDPLPYADILRFSEAFITSSSRAVLPVVKIDGTTIGTGQPGPVTSNLLAGYLARLERDLAPI
jgi:branched-chain amino acid aminotransferase